MEAQTIKPTFIDDRGEISDILIGNSIDAITKITSKKGITRGNHYHTNTTQWIYLESGQLLYLSRVGKEAVKKTLVKPGQIIKTPPLEEHAIEALEDSSFFVFTKGPRCGENYEEDTFRLPTPLQEL